MTADEREREIASLRDSIMECAEDIDDLRKRLIWRHASMKEMHEELARLIAQRTPAEVEQMERERGLR